MSQAISIDIRDGATPVLQRVMDSLRPERLKAVVGPACTRAVKRHLLANGTNKRGWPSTHFWARAARATSWSTVPGGVLVSINQVGVRQRFHGGTIRAVHKRALTIPISPEAYGKVASDFPNAFLLKTKKGAYLVQHGEEISGNSGRIVRRKGRGFAGKRVAAHLEFLFKLVQSVDQEPDSSVIPDAATLATVAGDAILDSVQRAKRGAA